MITFDTELRLLYQMSQLPILQNRLYDTETEARACPRGDMRLVQDLKRGLVFNESFQGISYDHSYQNEQAVSPLFRDHLEKVSRILEQNLGNVPLIEIGCGKGFFLEMLLARGFDIIGYDPAYEGEDPRVIKEYFRPRSGHEYAGLVLRHVLEHIQDPIGFLGSLRDAKDSKTKVYIEVPCFDWICNHRAWFDIFYEHVNYFRLSDFYSMFGTVYASGYLFGGQYLYVIADLASLREPRITPEDRILFPPHFTKSLDRMRDIRTSASVVWGGASKGVIFALLMERAGYPIDMVIDINPAKQGKYLPATGLLVRSPGEGCRHLPLGGTIYVMNSNYLDEIRKMSGNAYRYVGVDRE